MPYNEQLAARVRKKMQRRKGIEEKTMFGGVGMLLDGNMCVGVWKDFLILRLGEKQGEAALREAFIKEFDITGRAMKGWVMIEAAGVADDDDLGDWIDRAVKFVKTLPAK